MATFELSEKSDGVVIGIVRGCARCGEDHIDLFFKRFVNSCGSYTHWAFCPNTKEPILMRIVTHRMVYPTLLYSIKRK